MKFIDGFVAGLLTVGLLPTWILAVLTWRHKYGKWILISPKTYALKAAEIGDYLTLIIALTLWGVPIVLLLIFH